MDCDRPFEVWLGGQCLCNILMILLFKRRQNKNCYQVIVEQDTWVTFSSYKSRRRSKLWGIFLCLMNCLNWVINLFSVKRVFRTSNIHKNCKRGAKNILDPHFSFIISLLQLAMTWYKIRHAGGQAHYYSRTVILKQRDLNQWSLTCLCFDVPVRE